MSDERRFYEAPSSGARRSAPAALRNREPIAEVLADWLPRSGLVLEIASGTGEHVGHFAERFRALDWQPSDIHPDALASIAALREEAGLPNVRGFLRSGRYENEVIVDHRHAHELGARGVPFFVIDGRYGVSGAQSVEVFSQALARASRHVTRCS